MQYGIELSPYERMKKTKDSNEKKKALNAYSFLKLAIWFAISLLISRVVLINNTAPFGIAFLIVMCLTKERKEACVATLGTFIGYITLYSTVKNMASYLAMSILIATIIYFMKNYVSKNKALIIIISIIMMESIAYNICINELSVVASFLNSFLEIACTIPLYFIMDYGVICFKEIKTKHIFSNEEIISMAIISSLIVAGTWGVNIQGIFLKNVLGLIFIIIIGYTNGSAIGGAAGIAMGVIVGMSSNDIIITTSMYGTCGLAVGIFKDGGKWLSGIAYTVAFTIIKIYANGTNNLQNKGMIEFKFLEISIAIIVFFIIPNKTYEKLSFVLNSEKKRDYVDEGYIDKVKGIFVNKLNNFSDVLFNMSDILNNLVDNDRLDMQKKSSALIENLADRVCANCDMNSMCWKRELHYTYAAFGELIENYQGKRNELPKQLEKKCIKRTALLKNTEDIVNKYIISEMWRTRLSEGRELLATQINNIANSVDDIMDEINTDITINTSCEKLIFRVLEKNNINCNDILCLNDKNARLSVKIKLKSCGGSQLCVKEILPLINEATGKCMCVGDEGCSIEPNSNMCTATFEESPKYHIASYVARQCKEGEVSNGDSYSFGKLNDGTYMNVLCDGMGSGPQANRESEAAVELIEKFTGAGFSKITAINTINAIMSIKFSEEEKFSTVDLSSIDLYTGEVEFMKVGAVASFIKSGDDIDIIKSKTLPMGILDKVDVEIHNKKVKNGDIIIMVTDGVLDCDPKNIGKVDWIIDYMGKNNCNNPKELAEGLINEAQKISGNKVKDDMTIIVSKVYSIY